MDLKVLGCHGGETARHRTSSFLVGDDLAIDAGAITSQLSLEEQHKIRSVLVSHSHMDHVRDLATLADNRCQQGGPSLEIIGIPAALNSLREHFFNNELWPDFSKIDTALGPTVTYREIHPNKSVAVGNMRVTPVLVDHTIETSGFIVESDTAAIAYSGDTGPTKELWEHINQTKNMCAVLMEVSFPNTEGKLANVSGHHTPATLEEELKKLKEPEMPVLLYHIKPYFESVVEKELAKIKSRNLTLLRLGDQFHF